jgi:hypothetical protein
MTILHVLNVFSDIKDLNLSPLPGSNGNNATSSSIQTIITVVTTIVGALCLLFVTIGGFRYILSQGDPQGVSKAKGTIVYALIGLVIVVLARALVGFVFKKVTT